MPTTRGTKPISWLGFLVAVLVATAVLTPTTQASAASAATWSSISTGAQHTCGIQTDGSAWCWGDNSVGQLGSGSTASKSAIPLRVKGSGTWQMISTGAEAESDGEHTCGIKQDHSAWCWGRNDHGQLGDGTTTKRATPKKIVGSSWKWISTGEVSTCGIQSDDSAWCWGFNYYGQLGNNSTTDALKPVRVASTASWNSIEAAGLATCGVQVDGSAWCWGSNYFGELGTGDYAQHKTPARVAGPGTWRSVSPFAVYTCGVKTDNTAWCWGDNFRGEFGNGTSGTISSTPVAVNGGASWSKVSTGASHTCGIKVSGLAFCWGWSQAGQLGNGANPSPPVNYLTPTRVSGGRSWSAITTGGNNSGNSCGITTSGVAYCWGYNSFGQGGDGSYTDIRTTPSPVT